MPSVIPNFAVVRPRVVAAGTDEPRPLDEVVAELADELASGLVRITGSFGSGKSSALAHLAAVFGGDNHLVFLDEPSQEELESCPQDALVFATMLRGAGRGLELALEPWGQDELIEYLLAKHRDGCSSVIIRLGDAANWQWPPELASVVLDRFIADETLTDPVETLANQVRKGLTTRKQVVAAERFCLAVLVPKTHDLVSATKKLAKAKCPQTVLNLLHHELVQLPLAAERIVSDLSTAAYFYLDKPLPWKLIELVGRRCRGNPTATNSLRWPLSLRRIKQAEPMAASIMHAADPTWRPEPGTRSWNLVDAILREAQWPGVNLAAAEMSGCDLTGANLEATVLDNAIAVATRFTGTDLRGASLIRIQASQANFRRANLERASLPSARLTRADFAQANLSQAALMMASLSEADFSSTLLRQADLSQSRLVGATFDDADLTGAVLDQADLTGCDLRQARLDGARFTKAIFKGAQLECVRIVNAQMRGANFHGAHLTGSSLPLADLYGADLRGAGLGEIEWEGADLREANLKGATFHMGSSRSGLVGSPIACEGSKTGFYTDDLEDLTFKRPEEVRKANLRGADLRGVKADGVDFYLVDLRDAKLDPALREQAGQTGAILEDLVA